MVHFSPPETPFTINAVKIYTTLEGTGYEDQNPKIEIWDKDFALLHSWQEPATGFNKDPGWVTVDIPDITVDDDFYVVFYTYSKREGGVYIHFDSSVANKHSETADPGGTIADWVWQQPKDKTNWMIRAVEAAAEEGAIVSSPPAKTIEISAELKETVNSLDDPQKLSRWLLDNIQYESHYEIWKETGVNYIATPEEIFNDKAGCCAEFTVFACYVLQHHGYEAKTLRIAVESDPSKNHGVCVYQSSDSLYIMNVGRIEGPFQTYEDIAFDHHQDWSQYDLHHSWENYQQLKKPDEVVYRD
ncbi:MAG: transglutaminase-like domain-containing protein [Dehalococcoidales bacterium]